MSEARPNLEALSAEDVRSLIVAMNAARKLFDEADWNALYLKLIDALGDEL